MVLCLTICLSLAISPPVRASTRTLDLYVNALGWAVESGRESNPGPTISVRQTDQVTITLHSEDPLPHALVINYPDPTPDYVSPTTSGTTTFTVPADLAGDFPYYDLKVPLNGGTWQTRANNPPSAKINVPTAATSWTGGTAHEISLDLNDLDQDPMQVTVTYSYGGGANQTINSFTAAANPNLVPWTPGTFTASDTIVHVTVQDSYGGVAKVDSPPFEVDSIAPTIASAAPASGATQVDRNSLMQINWSEPMNEGTTGSTSAFGIRVSGGAWLAGIVSWTSNARQMIFRPAATLAAGTVYEVHVNATAKDSSDPGNPFGQAASWTFSTGSMADRTPPLIQAVSANPSVQIANGYVNLTAEVQDNVGIALVSAAIKGPGLDQNLTMTRASGNVWYVNRTYSAIGHYDVIVWATDASGNVASHSTSIDIAPVGTANLPAPQWVNVTVTDGLVDVTWSQVASPNLAGYHVYRGDASAGPFTRLTAAPIPPSAPTVYRDSSAEPGHTYYYTVRSVNTTGAESPFSPVFTVSIPPYQNPPLFDPVPWAVAGVTLGVILGALYGMVWRRRPA